MWSIPTALALRRQRQKDHMVKSTLDYTVNPRSA